MSIKVEMFIKLPYIIKLDEEKDYKFSFQFDNFEMFNLEMRHNNESDNDIYDDSYKANSCKNIRIEAIYNNCDYSKYETFKIPYIGKDKNRNEFTVELPFEETEKIFNSVNKRLIEVINYLRNETNMFWMDTLPINPIAYCFGSEIDFYFYSPNARLSKFVKHTRNITDYYMEFNFRNIKKINENVFDSFDAKENYFNTCSYYLNKSEKSLYERNYEDFIIYCSISVESFIRSYIGHLEPVNDIIYNRLSSSNYDYLDQYYNILLKYLKGTSLRELNETSFTYLKRMYTLRNAIMHKGIIDEVALKKSGLSHLKHINFNECKKILESVKESFSLINNL